MEEDCTTGDDDDAVADQTGERREILGKMHRENPRIPKVYGCVVFKCKH